MHRFLETLRYRCALSSFVMSLLLLAANTVMAHPGHDHSVYSGVWPDHDQSDESAGLGPLVAKSQDVPYLSTWMLSDGSTGFSTLDPVANEVVSNVLANVNTVAYDSDHVYIRTSGVPSHDIGIVPPPDANPAKAGDIDATYRFTLEPTEELGEKTATGLGPNGTMVNGVAFYNQSDGSFWNAQTNELGGGGRGGGNGGEVWTTNALWSRITEVFDEDPGGGHSSPVRGSTNPNGSVLGTYHYHQLPTGLIPQVDPENEGSVGSPIVGFASDGYPVVGPYAYEIQADGTQTVVQMSSSYGLLEDNGVDEPRGPNGPTVADYELGAFIEDFVYYEGSGRLNEYNMAFVVFGEDGRAILTDESNPDGDWAYFLTLDVLDAPTGNETSADGDLAFPYTIGPNYFGVVEAFDPQATIVVPDDVEYFFQYVDGCDAGTGGDLDGNGIVDFADFLVLSRNFGDAVDDHTQGDVDCSGTVDFDDFIVLSENYGGQAESNVGAVAVPEADSCLLLFLGLSLSCFARRRVRH